MVAGSDVASLTTTAERRGNHYIVNGAKKWITNGSFADYCMAAVRTGGEGAKGVSALVIPLHAKGVTCKKIPNSGVHASGMHLRLGANEPELHADSRIASTYIELDGVEVPIENLIGSENRGFEIIMSSKSVPGKKHIALVFD
jgi:alkylation response protein AidB-like acyl-CoA dehydrogenase